MTAKNVPDSRLVQANTTSDLRYGHYYIHGYLQGAVSEGYDPYAILREAGISPEAYTDPQASLDGVQLLSLLKTIMYTLDDVYLGFLQDPGKRAMEHEINRVAVKSETLGDAVRNLLRFHTAIRNDMVRDYGSDIPAHEFYIQLVYKNLKPDVDRHLFYFYRIAYNYRVFSWFICKQIKLTRVSFNATQPAGTIDYGQYFNCEVNFNQKRDDFHFDSSYLSQAILRTESELGNDSHQAFLGSHPDWNQIPGELQRLHKRIKRLLEAHYEKTGELLSMDQVAARLNLTLKTLERHLQAEETAFRYIKLGIKQKIAKKLLKETELSIASIAEKVGFKEPGHFARAFKQWTGGTPTAYRKADKRENV